MMFNEHPKNVVLYVPSDINEVRDSFAHNFLILLHHSISTSEFPI